MTNTPSNKSTLLLFAELEAAALHARAPHLGAPGTNRRARDNAILGRLARAGLIIADLCPSGRARFYVATIGAFTGWTRPNVKAAA